MEACYDTPWDRQCVNAHLLINGYLVDKSKETLTPSPRLTPPCGIEAQRLLKSKQSQETEPTARPDCEYDVPWDRGRVERRIKGELTSLRRNRPTSQTNTASQIKGNNMKAHRCVKASSVCFSSETDAVVPRISSPPYEKRQPNANLKYNEDDELLVCCVPSALSSSSASPASCTSGMSKTSSTSISLSKLATCLNGGGLNDDHVVPQYDNINTGVDHTPIAPRSKIKSPSPRVGTPLVETVFYGVSPCQPSSDELLASIEAIERDKLMQKLSQCAQLSPKKPKPNARKSKQANIKKTGIITNDIETAPDLSNKSKKIVQNNGEIKQQDVEYDVPCDSSNQSARIKPSSTKKEQPAKPVMELSRKSLSLNFGCAGLNITAETFDVNLPLEEQAWYHASISRNEAEGRLKNAKEGSYLVRICESNRSEYALSVKSAKGYMHMKIQANASGDWILGYFSQPFACIPLMIKYYCINKLPIKGAEHMCLLHPLNDQLL